MTPVLDSSVVLAKFLGEPGADAIPDDAVATGRISAVNLSEVVAKLAERGVPSAQIAEVAETLRRRSHAFDAEQAVAAGLLRPATLPAGLSLGDRACLALAQALGAPVLTADRAWAGLDVGLEIEVIR